MKNLTEKQKHSPIKSRRFYRRQMWLPALVLIASILLLWQNAGENSHSPRRMDAEAAALVRGSDLAKLTASSLGKRMQRAAAAGKLYREKQFVIGIPAREMGDWDSDERILIQGIIDAFFEEDGKLVLVDYKTDYVENSDILIRRYEAQVRYYTRALEQMTGKRVAERYLYSFRFGAIEV